MSFKPISFAVSAMLLMAAWGMLSSGFQYQEWIAAVLVGIAVALVLNRVIPSGGKRMLVLHFPILILVLLKEMIVANLDVAYRVLHPKMPIRPGIVEIDPGIQSDMGKLVLANAITLTPGTLSMDYDDDRIYVHWINVKEGKDPLDAVRTLRDRVGKVFE